MFSISLGFGYYCYFFENNFILNLDEANTILNALKGGYDLEIENKILTGTNLDNPGKAAQIKAEKILRLIIKCLKL